MGHESVSDSGALPDMSIGDSKMNSLLKKEYLIAKGWGTIKREEGWSVITPPDVFCHGGTAFYDTYDGAWQRIFDCNVEDWSVLDTIPIIMILPTDFEDNEP